MHNIINIILFIKFKISKNYKEKTILQLKFFCNIIFKKNRFVKQIHKFDNKFL